MVGLLLNNAVCSFQKILTRYSLSCGVELGWLTIVYTVGIDGKNWIATRHLPTFHSPSQNVIVTLFIILSIFIIINQ